MSVKQRNHFRTLVVLTASAVAVATSILSVGPAGAAPPPGQGGGGPAAALHVIEDVAPEVLADAYDVSMSGIASGAVSVQVAPSGADSVQVESSTISIPSDPASGLTASFTGGPSLKIQLPDASSSAHGEAVEPGVVEFDNNKHSFSTVPVVKSDGSLEIATTITKSSAPTKYAYKLKLPRGAKIQLDEFGGAYVLAADGKTPITAVQPAWAIDAKGKPVATHYKVAGSKLIQIVDHRAKGVTYPVVADPWWGYQWYLSSTSTNQLIAAIGTGAGLSTIVAAVCTGTIVGIPCGIVAGVVAGLLTISAGVYAWCNAAGRGIVINRTWNGITWCTSR